MGFRGGGGQIDPPQHILVFKYPSRDRVKVKEDNFKLLGYEVDKGRIIPNKNKLNILKHFKTPNSVTELQRFRLFDLHQAFNSIESHRFNVCSKPIVIREK